MTRVEYLHLKAQQMRRFADECADNDWPLASKLIELATLMDLSAVDIEACEDADEVRDTDKAQRWRLN